MKRILIVGVCVLALAFAVASSSAETGGSMMVQQKGEMKQGGMSTDDSVMKQMMGQGMMMRDMMDMMMDMMKMQKKMMQGMKPAEKKEMMMDMDKMMARMDKMMSDMRLMMMQKCMQPSSGEKGKEEQKKEAPAAPEGHQHKH